MNFIYVILIFGVFAMVSCQGPYLVYGPESGDLESIYAKPSQHFPAPISHRQPYLYAEPAVPITFRQIKYQREYAAAAATTTSGPGPYQDTQAQDLTIDFNDPDGDNILGMAGQDYPILSEIPHTGFQCSEQQHPGYYADQEAQCQVFHICQDDGRNSSFLCPNGTIFNQEYFVCDWWYNVNCTESSSYFDLNVVFEETTESTTEEQPATTPGIKQPQGIPPLVVSYGPAPAPPVAQHSYGTRYHAKAKPQVSQIPQSYQRPQEPSVLTTYSQIFNPDLDTEVDLH